MKQGRPDAAKKILKKTLKAVHKKQCKNHCVFTIRVERLKNFENVFCYSILL